MSEEIEKFEQTKEKKFKQTKQQSFKQSGEVVLIFKYNRSFELHIGRKIYMFCGRESKKLPSTILKHPDFTDRIKSKFVIKEV